ncbi:hypothetical protein [Mesorhizobium sp. M7A.F.Ca.MR.362.00.0.0]|uniref:hypothetical protein n=1 Tax=Mesorhizobium sp. M7A.F.Ca.MR.362.00.0.0 TaxID=2496779 RepID=UPI000FD2C6F1|nr:hypothetical protein [Mesorhizobium sp. M7A.F.Ca.MR.362.00.0.0]RUU76133.1 hypothetical protein EOC06_28155 [Mesorhizobium sp. M7A.F.Ca.MR.362.00.0.0]RWN95395.1 MAG: hypothetical protein EOS05_11420 [Mesorhizobium sp.]
MTTSIYRVDVMICGTAYIKASSREVAQLILDDHKIEETGPLISEHRFDDPKLPEFSLSPAMTLYGRFSAESEIEEAN